MIITDINGGKLKLSKTRLTEMTGESVDGFLWYIPLKDLLTNGEKEIYCLKSNYTLNGYAMVAKSRHKIGCRIFDRATFEKIMAAARATKKKGPIKK